jgi:hypothetical protein
MTATGTSSVEMRVGQESFDIGPFLEEFVWTDSLLRGGFSWSLRLKANVWREWWDLTLGRERPTIRFRMKAQEQGYERTTEWRRAVTDWSRAAFSQDPAMLLEVHGADRRLDLQQVQRLRSFPESLASDVVVSVAADHGLSADVVPTKVERDRWQLREDDWTFLQRQILTATSQDGRGDIFLYMEEDQIRLVVPQSQAPSVRRHDTASIENRLNDYIVQYHGRQIDRLGGAALRGVGFDFGAKQALTFDVGGQEARVHPALARKVPRRQDDGVRHVIVTDTTDALVEETTRSRWGMLGPRYFSIRISTRPDVELRPNEVVEIAASDDPDRQSVFQGRYLLLEVQHRYVDGAIVSTTAVGYRREAAEGEEEPTGAAADTVRTRDRFQGDTLPAPTTVIFAEELP